MNQTTTLPGVEIAAAAAAVSGTVQWRLELLQVVNWGGFAGVHTLRPDPRSTLLSGQSGTGKSTLLDSNIALLMPASTAFNGASNDAGGGRARGEEQRSLLSYLRGQVDTTSDGDNTRKAKVLRGDGRPTWGAIAGRYVSDTGHRFTVLRAYYAPAAAIRDRDLVTRLATFDGAMDLSLLAPLAANRFQSTDMKAAFPGLLPHDTYAGFSDKVCTKLNIGSGGDGAKALALLARIQAGRQIRSVDELYKQMVLEEPATFAAADLALAHFDELDDTYQQMVSEKQRASLLAPLPGYTEQLSSALATIEQVASLGLSAQGWSPLSKWEADQESTLVAAAERATSAECARVVGELTAAQTAATAAGDLHQSALAAFNAGGGQRILQIDDEIRASYRERTRRENQRALLAEKTAGLDLADGVLDDAARYAELQTAADQFAETFPAREKGFDPVLGAAAVAVTDATRDIERLDKEIQGARTRRGRVPKHLDDQRLAVCEATGLSREELPFVAELLDVPADQEQWRTAIEVSLAGSARLMLVPQERIGQVSAAIDRMRWNHRMRFEAAGHHLPRAATADPSTVAGKLVLADSPFAGWVSDHISDQRRNATCVQEAAGLNGPGMRVTAAGQTRHGATYAHGRSPNERNIIGFDNAAAVEDLERERDQVIERRERARGEYDTLAAERGALREQKAAWDAVLSMPFNDVDVADCDATVARLEEEKEELQNANSALAALSRKRDVAQKAWEEATKAVGALERQLKDLTAEWNALIERADGLIDIQLEHEQLPAVAPGAIERLQQLWELATTEESRSRLGEWQANRRKLREALGAESENAEIARDQARDSIEGILRTYQELHYDPDLTTSVAGVGDFLAIYERILATGLAQRTQQWRDQLLKWSGEDLVPLTRALVNAVTEVKNRLHPINDILRALPFGATNDRLQIDLRHVQDATVLGFRRRLTELSSGATRDLPPEQLGARFKALKDFMALIRSDKDPRVDRNVADRGRLLDVRRHVHVTAKSVDSSGMVTATFDSLGGKSGGETQELIAFIVGAALRYRLGDQLRDRPRFAPVFLDEAFIKADAEFSGRAVSAWLGLGFQLIIGAPTDKVAALEPYMESLVSVTKDHSTSRSYLTVMTDAERGPVTEPQAS